MYALTIIDEKLDNTKFDFSQALSNIIVISEKKT